MTGKRGVREWGWMDWKLGKTKGFFRYWRHMDHGDIRYFKIRLGERLIISWRIEKRVVGVCPRCGTVDTDISYTPGVCWLCWEKEHREVCGRVVKKLVRGAYESIDDRQ